MTNALQTLGITLALIFVGWYLAVQEARPESFVDRSGQVLTMSELKPYHRELLANKPSVYILWAVWCPTCLASIPVYNQLAKQYAGRVNFVALALENNQATEEYARLNLEFAAAHDSSGHFIEFFAATMIPFVAITDEGGKVLWQGNEFEPELLKRLGF